MQNSYCDHRNFDSVNQTHPLCYCNDHCVFLLAPAGPSKPALKRTEKTAEPLPALRKPAETPADAAKNWLSSAMAEANTPSGNIAAASKVNLAH